MADADPDRDGVCPLSDDAMRSMAYDAEVGRDLRAIARKAIRNWLDEDEKREPQ